MELDRLAELRGGGVGVAVGERGLADGVGERREGVAVPGLG